MNIKGFFKKVVGFLPESDPARHNRWVQEEAQSMKNQGILIRKRAMAVGFTVEQAEFLEICFSPKNHRHEYRSGGHSRITWEEITGEQSNVE